MIEGGRLDLRKQSESWLDSIRPLVYERGEGDLAGAWKVSATVDTLALEVTTVSYHRVLSERCPVLSRNLGSKTDMLTMIGSISFMQHLSFVKNLACYVGLLRDGCTDIGWHILLRLTDPPGMFGRGSNLDHRDRWLCILSMFSCRMKEAKTFPSAQGRKRSWLGQRDQLSCRSAKGYE